MHLLPTKMPDSCSNLLDSNVQLPVEQLAEHLQALLHDFAGSKRRQVLQVQVLQCLMHVMAFAAANVN